MCFLDSRDASSATSLKRVYVCLYLSGSLCALDFYTFANCLMEASSNMLHSADVALELNAAEAKLAAIESEVQKFQKWLGLTFIRSEGKLAISEYFLVSRIPAG